MNIINKNNEVIINYKELIKKNDDEYIAIDDINIIKLAYDYKLEIKDFFYCYELDYHKETIDLINQISDYAVNSYMISKKTYLNLINKENSVGLFAIIKIKYNYDLKELKELNKDYLIICDGIEIPGNLGTIYRTSDSAKVDALVITNLVTHPYNYKNTIASRGCNIIMPTTICNIDELIEYLIDNEYDVYLGEPKLGLSYKDYDYQGKIAIVVGNERFGIDKKWYEVNNDHFKKVFIPMYGSNNSLNVSVAASILIYEASTKRF